MLEVRDAATGDRLYEIGSFSRLYFFEGHDLMALRGPPSLTFENLATGRVHEPLRTALPAGNTEFRGKRKQAAT